MILERPEPEMGGSVHACICCRFHIMGGECNYLLRVAYPSRRLEFVPDEEWKSPYMMSWQEGDIRRLLDEAEASLLEGAKRLRLPVEV